MSLVEDKVPKSKFTRIISEDLKEIFENMNDLRKKSVDGALSERELEQAFDYLYDAKELLEFYLVEMKLREKDAFLKKEWKWVSNYMNDLVEYGVGPYAEIKRHRNPSLKNKMGNVVGDGDEIRVMFLPPDQRSDEVILRNWLEIDEKFWQEDHYHRYDEYMHAKNYRQYNDERDY